MLTCVDTATDAVSRCRRASKVSNTDVIFTDELKYANLWPCDKAQNELGRVLLNETSPTAITYPSETSRNAFRVMGIVAVKDKITGTAASH
jgi:hypothetical protein